MMNLSLMLFTDGVGAELTAAVRCAALPPCTTMRIADYDQQLIQPDHCEVLVLTAHAQTVEHLLPEKGQHMHILYIGNPQDLWALDAMPDANWSFLHTAPTPEKAVAALRTQLEGYIQTLRTEADAFFNQQLLLKTTDSLPDLFWVKRLDGIHMLVNDEFAKTVHKDKQDIIGQDHFFIWDVPHPDENTAEFACAESEEKAIGSGTTYICDESVKTREGMKQLTTYKTPLYDWFGQVFGTVGIGHDVTDFSNLGVELSILIENIPFPMAIFNAKWGIIRMNSAFMEITGTHMELKPDWSEDKNLNFDYRTWQAEHLHPVTKPIYNKRHHTVSQEFQFYKKNRVFSFIIIEQEVRDFFENVVGYFCVFQDITYQRAYEKDIIEAATTDSLTKLYNRRYFYDYLGNHMGQPLVLFYMDLDKFKQINDTFGHDRGDEVLVKASQIMEQILPAGVLARLGGDEFAYIYNGSLTNDSIDRLRTELETAIQSHFAQERLDLSVSIGVSVTEGLTGDVDRFIHAGDQEMYLAKKMHHQKG